MLIEAHRRFRHSDSKRDGVLIELDAVATELIALGDSDALAALTGVRRVAIMGTAVCTAHGTVTYGQIVMASDTTAHLGHVKTVTAGARQLGLALDTATDGQQVRVALFPAMNA